MNAILMIIGGLVGIPAVAAASMVWSGYALSILWGWFVVPLGAPTLSVPAAIGLSGIVGFMTYQDMSDLAKKSDLSKGWLRFGEKLAMCALKPAVALGIGYIVQGFL